jgi:hypothetical protein
LLCQPGALGKVGKPRAVFEVDETEHAAVPLANVVEARCRHAAEHVLDGEPLQLGKDRGEWARRAIEIGGHFRTGW